ncbi:ATP-binding protein [Hyphococcus flavus]|uniref:Sensory/regulatory protein RpfC n=1 Tax=Hyphococcus flavus TaxID=1866326 RepID=A0AAF0CH74_9PROT|nr:ATP-binding protein [Hyphococcus flavus]WDI33118.1 ATP-binding protein [Hyphococcus flavus]
MKITTRYLVISGSLMLVATIFTGWGLLTHFYDKECIRILTQLQTEVTARAHQHGNIFNLARDSQKHAIHAFSDRIAAWSSRHDVAEQFSKTFITQPDGTYRSRDGDFEGTLHQDGQWIYGAGAFIAPASEITAAKQKQLLAAYDVVTRNGEAARFWADNFYYYTPQNDLIIFAPDREDNLEFYRKTAPADFNFQDRIIGQHVRPEHNPDRAMRCTGLENVMYDQTGVRLTSGCQTPVDLNGRHVGAFGVSFLLNGWLAKAISAPIEGAKPFIMQADGEMIAHEGLIDRSGGEEFAKEFAKELKADQLIPMIAEKQSDSGMLRFTAWDSYVAYIKLDGPDWYFMSAMPMQRVRNAALASALPIAALCMLMGLSLILVSTFVLRKVIASPLSKLTSEAGDELDDASDAQFSGTDRGDEIGMLARSFQERDERFQALVASLDAKVKQRTAELEDARDTAEQANMAKSSFLANMSHEIRTPLNAIVGMTQVLDNSNLCESDRQRVDVMRAASFSLLDVINNVLDLSKIESGNLQYENISFSIEELVADTIATFEHGAKEKGIDIFAHVEAEAVGDYRSDPTKIKQVLTNLVSNAIKFTPKGSVYIEVSTSGEREDNQQLTFEVRDTGIGIDENGLEKIFNPFIQADSSTTRKFGGTGLGLAICKRIVEGLGGDISITSAPGQGSCFRFNIPVESVHKNNQTTASKYDAEGAKTLLKKLSVMVAEDQEPNRMVIEALLGPAVKKLSFAKNGLEAVALWRQGGIDLVLMDVQMPSLDGVEATQKIRAMEREKGLEPVPIIALTANAFTDQVAEYLAAGMNAHLAKPIDFRALHETIVKHVTVKAEAA